MKLKFLCGLLFVAALIFDATADDEKVEVFEEAIEPQNKVIKSKINKNKGICK
jgi:hypothetical protein